MSDEIVVDDGGPAFPTRGEDFIDGPQGRHPQSAWGMQPKEGMTLRDYFAGKALQGMLAGYGGDSNATIDEYASDAYRYADAMLKARSHGA